MYLAFAEILDYPMRPLMEPVNECVADLAPDCPEASGFLGKFGSMIHGMSLGTLQELYTNAFDLRPDCTPNLGYHLFGDDSRRGVFLAELKERMERSGIATGVELPDHISLLLRYVNAAKEERAVLIEDCLLPALSRIAEILDASGNPYRYGLRSLMLWLRFQQEACAQPADSLEA